MMNIAVLMTCHDRREITLRCLEAFVRAIQIRAKRLGSNEKLQWEFFIVDDGSTDGTGEALKRMFECSPFAEATEDKSNVLNGRVIKGNGNLFWAKGMALAWRTALESETNHQPPATNHKPQFSHFLWLNDDTILFPNALDSLLDLSRKNKNAVIVGSLVDEMTGLKTCGVKEDGLFTGNFVFIPKFAYEKVGLICDQFHHAWADSDYAIRCRHVGVRVLELEGVGATRAHDLRPSLRGVPLFERIRLLVDPKGWCVHDLWLYRRRNWGVSAAVLSVVHFVFHVLKGER